MLGCNPHGENFLNSFGPFLRLTCFLGTLFGIRFCMCMINCFLAIKQVDKEEQIKDMKINLQKIELEIMQLQNNLKEAENILVGFIECIYQNLMKKKVS